MHKYFVEFGGVIEVNAEDEREAEDIVGAMINNKDEDLIDYISGFEIREADDQ